jgi:hypothetical protein
MTNTPVEHLEASRKRLFIGLISGTSLLVCLILVLLWVIPYVGLKNIHPYAPWIVGTAVAILIVLVLWACLGLLLNLALRRSLPFTRRLRGLTIKLLLPLMTLLAMALRISKERVRSSFIKVNNELVAGPNPKYKPAEILLLMPHCLQNSRCAKRLTYNINNCARCGLCPITGLLSLAEHYGVHLAIATGGTIARRIVVQKRPKIILAVACERDLASGIQDTYPLPVYGVLNERPNGPCLDTLVPLERLEQAIVRFMAPDYLPEPRNIAAAFAGQPAPTENDPGGLTAAGAHNASGGHRSKAPLESRSVENP